VEKLILTRNRLEGPPFAQVARPTHEPVELNCGLVFRSIGYRAVAIPGLPFNDTLGTVPHTRGRVLDGTATSPGLYVTGWLKRGPTGIIGTNRADRVETVESLLADLSNGCDRDKRGAEAMGKLLERRGVQVFDYQNWSTLDTAEISRGKPKGKPREKFTRIDEMLAASTGRRRMDDVRERPRIVRQASILAGFLRVKSPADLPVQQTRKVELVINLQTAKHSALPLMQPSLKERACSPAASAHATT